MPNATQFVARISGDTVPGGGAVSLFRMFNAEALNGAVTINSLVNAARLGIPIGEFNSFGCWVQAAGSSPNFDLQIIQSWDDTEGNYVVPDVNGTVMTVTTTTARVGAVSPVALQNLRFRLVGGGGNGGDTTVTAYLWAKT